MPLIFYRRVDSSILWILRRRFEECVMYESPLHEEKCRPLYNTYNDALDNWFIKCKETPKNA